MKYRHSAILEFMGLLSMILAGCALTDVTSTEPSPVTLEPPPHLNFTGSCDDSKALENWLQITTGILSKFQSQMNDTAAQNRTDAFAGLTKLVALRNGVYAAATPDCAHDAQILLSDTLNHAVQAFQSYINGDLNDIFGKVAEINVGLDQVSEMHASLIARLQDEIKSRLQSTPTATA